MEQQNYMQLIEPDYKIEIGIKDGKAISLHWGQLVDNEKLLTNKEILQRVEKYLREGLQLHLKQNNSNPLELQVIPKVAELLDQHLLWIRQQQKGLQQSSIIDGGIAINVLERVYKKVTEIKSNFTA